ncbi:Xaa-Pro peptidase family protein [Dongia soli]|uniref:Xaa-Pro peptidase family protein n=1 Tax=Dongia soli TaxID=600628 RepID=A0ABU5EC53_9PROT|nr:Xaa-Pro peptidase family protein [Dongia soli]MDY0883936.1 Xaa-Pro peptidase family protein [Dongia soli]
MTKGIGGSSAAVELADIGAWTDQAAPISPAERQTRLDEARHLTSAMGADALLVNAGTSLDYFAGISWGASERLLALVLPRNGRPIIVCPVFERGSLEAELRIEADLRLWEEDEDPYALVIDALRQSGGTTLALDPAASFAIHTGLKQTGANIDIRDAGSVIDGCRSCKSPAELALMQQAKSMTLEVHRHAARILAPGITTTEVKRFIDQAHRAIGADNGSTFCIVQFGRATAYPHGLPGEQRLQEGDMVLIDTGCRVQGYHSDITRSYVFGTPTAEQRKVWALEQEAQQAAFDAVKPGLPCHAADDAARAVLVKAGLGPDYKLPGLPHRTGHGIGLAIHEAPYLVRGNRTPLAPGMCFSNEPMIVIPDQFGIRLEDHFYVTETGAAWFTRPSPSIDAPFG